MEFGDWLRDRRKQEIVGTKTLADRSHVDQGTINRIENMHTQATLCTAYRICKGLSVTFPELYYDLQNINTSVREQIPDDQEGVLNLNDVEVLLSDALDVPQKNIYAYFADVLNQIARATHKATAEQSEVHSEFTSQNMEALLSGIYRSVFRLDLRYPRDANEAVVLYNYKRGGVLLLEDIGAYVRNVRRLKQESLRKLESYTEISISVLSRFEDGALERIKLSDILTLDTALSQSGLLLDMCWDVCSFDEWLEKRLKIYKTRRGSATEESKRAQQLVLLYIRACRWFQYSQSPSFKWRKYRPSRDENRVTLSS